jgi:hypothetical protein
MVRIMVEPDPGKTSARTPDAFSRLMDGYFRDPSTGRVVLAEKPNGKIRLVGVLVGAPRLLRTVHMVEAGDPVEVFLERAAMAMLIWWSVDELRHGRTKYLKTIGGVTLVGAVLRTIDAERSRATWRA